MDYELKETIVIDDLFTPEEQTKYHDLVVNCPSWRFIKDMSYASFELVYPSFGFNMVFKHPKDGVLSPLYEMVSVPIMNRIIKETNIKIQDISFNRAFLQIPLEEKFYKDTNGIHIDLPEDHYACVYYLNDSDGDTILYEQNRYNTEAGSKGVELTEHKRVTPKKGRIVLFDGARYHCSSQPKDNYRAIINFDLIMEK